MAGATPHGRPRTRPGEHGVVRLRAVVDRREIPEGQPVPKGAQWRAIARLRLLNGRVVRVEGRGKTKAAAQAAFTARCIELLGPDAVTLSNRTLFRALAMVYLRWLDECETHGDKAPTTCEKYRDILRRHLLPALGDLELHEITPGTLTRMLRTARNKGVGAPTRRHIRVVIREALQLAVVDDALATNAGRELERITRDTDRPLPRALKPSERTDLLTKLRNDESAVRFGIYDLVVFMLGVGARISEALAVRWCDVDLVGVEHEGHHVPVAYLGPVIVAVKGKGLIRRDKGKTGTSVHDRRVVPLPRFVVDMLVLRRPEWARDDDPVFPAQSRRRGKQPTSGVGYRSANNVDRAWRVIRERHGYPWVTWHTLRKTAITEWKAMGLTDLQTADMAGHKQVSMTQNVYFGRNQLHPEAADRPGYDRKGLDQ